MIYISMRKEFRHTPLSDGQVVLRVSGGNALVDGGNYERLLFLYLHRLHDTAVHWLSKTFHSNLSAARTILVCLEVERTHMLQLGLAYAAFLPLANYASKLPIQLPEKNYTEKRILHDKQLYSKRNLSMCQTPGLGLRISSLNSEHSMAQARRAKRCQETRKRVLVLVSASF